MDNVRSRKKILPVSIAAGVYLRHIYLPLLVFFLYIFPLTIILLFLCNFDYIRSIT